MALEVYTPPTTAVIHETTVDIGNVRPLPKIIKLTQGDKSLPVIAIKLLNSGEPYKVPESATDARLNFLKGDGKAVINSALGVSEDRRTVYVEATEQTCAASGRGQAMLQVMIGEQVAGTGLFFIDVAPNPTTDASLSETEIGVLQGLVDEANDAKTDAQQSASNAEKSASNAQASADKASESAELAGQHKNDAESAKNSAEQFANTAEQEATDAESARDKAEEYMEKAQASSAVSNSSYYIGDDGMLHLSFNSEGLGENDIDQTLDKLSADVTQLDTDMGTVLMRQVNLANCISAPSFTISGRELLRIDIPSSYRGKRAMFELVGMSLDVVTGMASIEARQIDGNNQTTPFLAIDAGQGTNKPISRITTVNIDADTTAINLVGMLGSTSASARITSGTNFYCKVTILAN